MATHLWQTVAKKLQQETNLSEIRSRKGVDKPSSEHPSGNELPIFHLPKQLRACVSSRPFSSSAQLTCRPTWQATVP